MVLNITLVVVLCLIIKELVLELSEYNLWRLMEYISKSTKSTSMSHSEYYVIYFLFSTLIDKGT